MSFLSSRPVKITLALCHDMRRERTYKYHLGKNIVVFNKNKQLDCCELAQKQS